VRRLAPFAPGSVVGERGLVMKPAVLGLDGGPEGIRRDRHTHCSSRLVARQGRREKRRDIMSKNIVPGALTEGLKQAKSRALTDDELNVVVGGATYRDPFVRTVMNAFFDTILCDGYINGVQSNIANTTGGLMTTQNPSVPRCTNI
jgi:hypothetical protein